LTALMGRRGHLFNWIPVCLACGIGLWFAAEQEPGPAAYGMAACVVLGAFGARVAKADLFLPLAFGCGAVALGFLAAGARGHLVASPMLEAPYYGPVEGRIVAMDRSQSDALRLTLDRVVLRDLAPDRTPSRVRISLQGTRDIPDPGQVVLVTARLAASDGPAEPGGFDFRRMAFFDGLGAVGYTHHPLVLWAEPAPGADRVNRLRMGLSRAIMARVPGDAGAFASGAMTGDRSGISKDTVEALRDSNLAHLLAISGMNMAFLTGFVFLLIRSAIALIPLVALRVNAKKIAAVVAFGVALFYLLLSGSNVATERAFLMVSVMLGAVLLDRRALTLRSMALAAIVLLLWTPESLTEPGFQLSFAASIALVAGFEALDRQILAEHLPRVVMPLFTLVLSSVLAGAATAPFAAATFNRFTDYGLVANLLTVPMMSLVMAAGAMAALLAPFGAADPALWVMGKASEWILFIAHWIAGLEGAVTPIWSPGPVVIPLISLAGLWFILMPGRERWAAIAPACVAIGLWVTADRPHLLVSADGKAVGLMGPEGRAIAHEKGAGFAVESWLEKDGDLARAKTAHARPGFQGQSRERRFTLAEDCTSAHRCAPTIAGKILIGKYADLARACAKARLVIAPNSTASLPVPEGCVIIDQATLRRSGAIAISASQGAWHLTTAKRSGRLWMDDTAIPHFAPLQ
jgi:competence protein ComEC